MKQVDRREHYKKSWDEVFKPKAVTFKRKSVHGLMVDVIGREDEVRKCTRCGEIKNQSCFHLTQSNVHGQRRLKRICKVCCNKGRSVCKKLHRTKNYRYPKTNHCEVCKKVTNKLCLDHNHYTHVHRGWLCQECNTAIGKIGARFGDDIKGIEAILKYLKERDETPISYLSIE